MIKTYIQIFLKQPLLVYYSICHPISLQIINHFIVGAVVVGIIGIISYFIHDILRVRQVLGGLSWLIQGIFIIIWFLSLNNRSFGRVCLFVGCGIASKHIYSQLHYYVRKYSQRLGDYILEPNFLDDE